MVAETDAAAVEGLVKNDCTEPRAIHLEEKIRVLARALDRGVAFEAAKVFENRFSDEKCLCNLESVC